MLFSEFFAKLSFVEAFFFRGAMVLIPGGILLLALGKLISCKWLFYFVPLEIEDILVDCVSVLFVAGLILLALGALCGFVFYICLLF